MRLSSIKPLLAICLILTVQYSEARPEKVVSPRSNVTLNSGKIAGSDDQRLVRISVASPDGKNHEAQFFIDKSGVKTLIIPQGFPLRITLWRPSEERPYAVAVLERQKEGIDTVLVDAVALRYESPEFLDADLFKQLKQTHSSTPDVIDGLNEELNRLTK